MEATLNNVSTTFRENALANPQLDENNQKSIYIQRLIRSYKNEDPPPNCQQCLPLSAFKSIYEDRSSKYNAALGQLITGALFFACRSCEYSKVNNSESRKTKILTLEDIKFFKDLLEVRVPGNFKYADFIQLTFVSQKNNMNNQSIIQHKSSFTLCPVKIWAELKCRILSYPRTSEKSTVNIFLQRGRLVQFTSEAVRTHLRDYIKVTDPLETFYKASKIGTHSIRTSFAMILHDIGVSPYIIKLIGRWLSDAWLSYIRQKLPDFSQNIAKRMVKSNAEFKNLPNPKTKSQIHGHRSVPNLTEPNDEPKAFHIWY